jgi:putative solute:sodium symporter small subunit
MKASRPFNPEKYWTRTLRRLVWLLALWLLAGPVAGILLIEPLNRVSLGGIPFGFWMAQQGSIFTFVVLIFLNAWLAERLDREFEVDETPESVQHLPPSEH